MKNERRERWKKLSSQRMSRVLWTTELIANLSSHNYEYKDEWLEYLFDGIKQKGDEIKEVFQNPAEALSNKLISEFEFPEEMFSSQLTPKELKFRNVAERRMTKLYKEMNYFSRLANTKNYTYDSIDVDFLFDCYSNKYYELVSWFPPLIKDRVCNDINIADFPSEI